MRRSVVSLFVAVSLALFGLLPVSLAQEATPAAEATPESGLADLGLPTLDVTVTATGFEGVPETLDAGRYLVTITAAGDTGEFGGDVGFIQPSGMSADEFLGLLMSGP